MNYSVCDNQSMVCTHGVHIIMEQCEPNDIWPSLMNLNHFLNIKNEKKLNKKF